MKIDLKISKLKSQIRHHQKKIDKYNLQVQSLENNMGQVQTEVSNIKSKFTKYNFKDEHTSRIKMYARAYCSHLLSEYLQNSEIAKFIYRTESQVIWLRNKHKELMGEKKYLRFVENLK